MLLHIHVYRLVNLLKQIKATSIYIKGLEICHKTNFYKFLVFIYFLPNQSCHNVALWRTSKVVSKE